MPRTLFTDKEATGLGSCVRVNFPKMVSFHTYHMLSGSEHQTSPYQLAIKLVMPTHHFGRRGEYITMLYYTDHRAKIAHGQLIHCAINRPQKCVFVNPLHENIF